MQLSIPPRPLLLHDAVVPDDLVATVRRPTYLVVEWRAPPSPFSGNYRLTYGQLGGMTNTSIIVTGTSYNITGLRPFTNYMVTVQANNTPVVEFGPPLSGVFATLPEVPIIPPGEEAPSVTVPQVQVGRSGIVEIVLPLPAFSRQDFVRYNTQQFIYACTIEWIMLSVLVYVVKKHSYVYITASNTYTCSNLLYHCFPPSSHF